MAFLLTITLQPWEREPGKLAPAPPEKPLDKWIARLNVDLETKKWKVIENERWFTAVHGDAQGSVVVSGPDVTLTGSKTNLYLKLFYQDFRANLKGIAYYDARKCFNLGAILTGTREKFNLYAWYWRELSYVEMTAEERMREVIYRCCEKYLAGAAKQEFGNLVDAKNLAIVVGIMLVFMATVGGWIAALRAFVGVLLTGSGFYVDIQFYRDQRDTIAYFVTNTNLKPSQAANALESAAKAMAEVFSKILADFCMAKFGHALARATGELRGLFTKRSKAEWEQAARQSEAESKTEAASQAKSKDSQKAETEAAARQGQAPATRPGFKQWMARYLLGGRRGPLGLNFGIKGCKKASGAAECNLLAAEYKGYLEISHMGDGNCMVLREPSKNRLSKLKQGVIATSKDIEVVAKSFTADRLKNPKLVQYHGYVGVSASDIKGTLRPAGSINLHGIDPNLPNKPAKLYSLDPKTSDVKGLKSAQESRGVLEDKGRASRPMTDHEAKAVRDRVGLKALEDTLFCDIGEGRYILISRGTGLPSIPDVDVLAAGRVRNGALVGDTRQGVSLSSKPLRPSKQATPEFAGDDPQLGRHLNDIMRKNVEDAGIPNMGFYNWFNHSEHGGSASFRGPDGKPSWNPVDKSTGAPPAERLIMFVKGECFIFDSWWSYKAWCWLNNLGLWCPWEF
ncbi:MAG: hypothetical protein HY821_23880 [Acidobacteria bacterium]|nr:hypothetical protein [Acidobacteriota bacterium]